MFHESKNDLNTTTNILFGTSKLQWVKEVKYLGLIIDSSLSWTPHILHLKNKISALVGIIGKIKYLLTIDTLRLIYFTMIQSRLSYLCFIWGNTTQNNLNTLEVLQNRVIRFMYGFHQLYSRSKMYSETNILPLKQLISLNASLVIHKILHNEMFTNSKFPKVTEIHLYNTRQKNKLHVFQNYTTKFGTRGVQHLLISEYNSVPDNITIISKTLPFRNKLKKYLLGTLDV